MSANLLPLRFLLYSISNLAVTRLSREQLSAEVPASLISSGPLFALSVLGGESAVGSLIGEEQLDMPSFLRFVVWPWAYVYFSVVRTIEDAFVPFSVRRFANTKDRFEAVGAGDFDERPETLIKGV